MQQLLQRAMIGSMSKHEQSPWVLVAYQTPASPSTARVSAWRGLHGLGALYLGPTVCLLPARIADPSRLDAIGNRVRAAGGTFDVLQIEAFGPDAEVALRVRYNEARAAEYAEIVERAEALLGELEREAARDKFTFAEVEENETGVTKIRQWLRRVIARDVFASEARSSAEWVIDRAEAQLAQFTEQAVARESNIGGASTSEDPRLRLVGGGS